MRTCSFKETESYSVCSRLDKDEKRVLVVASAGNTARAFAQVCSDNQIPLLLSVPEDNLNALWFDAPLNNCVKLIASKSGGDYYDAIHLSNIACEMDQFIPEGGAKNVARRDGMATTMLSAATHIGEIPEYYFQAIGSGTGAIAAWEANLRLILDGRFGNRKAKLMVSQNFPFHPIYDAWKADSRDLLPFDHDEARKQVEIIDAKVLSNRKPPYSLAGGLFDALKDAGGDVLLATNEESRAAAQIFLKTEGIDIHPASAVATATLIDAVKKDQIEKDALIMLNITGGGEERFKSDNELFYLTPLLVFETDPNEDFVKQELDKLVW
jgi:cysteate synthase